MAKKTSSPNDRSGNDSSNISPRELVVKVRPDVGFRASREAGPSATETDVSPVAKILQDYDAVMEPLFGLSEERIQSRATSAEAAVAQTQEMATFYSVQADDSRLEDLAESIRQLEDAVEAAYIKPPSGEPVAPEVEQEAINDMEPLLDQPPVNTPDFTPSQIYLNPAPEGIDARYAWTIGGGRGAGVRIIDCEWGWNFSHEDLGVKKIGVVYGGNSSNNNHGTAVLGEYSGDVNGFGITGICPDAIAGASSFVSSPSSARTIREAADKLSSGDIILLEIHRGGPNYPGGNTQFGFIAIEWWPDDYAAIRYALNKGIIVVEAAGNGSQNLDAAVYNTRPNGFPASWRNPFNPANPTSGAVVVGAGAPPPGTHGRNHGPDRSRLGFSNYGARVDCQGWGREVTSTGYGNLQGGGSIHRNEWYTETFSGTSSASPIVVGALGCVQGILKAQGSPLLTPSRAISLLRTTGSPQQDAPGRPATQRIGKRPNLRQIIPMVSKIWKNNVSVTRVYTSHHSQNAWALIGGVGWRRLETTSKDGVTNMFVLFCEAVANGKKVDVYMDGSKVYRAVLH